MGGISDISHNLGGTLDIFRKLFLFVNFYSTNLGGYDFESPFRLRVHFACADGQGGPELDDYISYLKNRE